MEENQDWAPGWDTIEQEFERLYPGQEPVHYGTNMVSRAIFGGDNYLDGYSVYDSPKGYKQENPDFITDMGRKKSYL